MSNKKSYPEEIFEWRLKKYKGIKRSKLPNQVEIETCGRVNRLALHIKSGPKFPLEFLSEEKDFTLDDRLPFDLFDSEILYDEISDTIEIRGSGGSVIIDDRTCKVDFVRYLLDLTQPESCGECTFCRIGTVRMSEILNRISGGQGKDDDIEKLEDLAKKINSSTLCVVGKTAASPVVTILSHFREEYEEHIRDNKCRSGKCKFDSISVG